MIQNFLKSNWKNLVLAVIVLLLFILSGNGKLFKDYNTDYLPIILPISILIIIGIIVGVSSVNFKTKLPIKTKMAAYWLAGIGVMGIILSAYIVLSIILSPSYGARWGLLLLIPSLPSSLVLFFLGLILFTKKRWAWWFTTLILFIGTIVLLIGVIPFLTNLTFFLIPSLALLLFDRENYFKVTA